MTVGVEGRCRPNPGPAPFGRRRALAGVRPSSPGHHRRHRHLRGRPGLRTPLRELDNRGILLTSGRVWTRTPSPSDAWEPAAGRSPRSVAGPYATSPERRAASPSPAATGARRRRRERHRATKSGKSAPVLARAHRGARPHRVALLTCQAVAVVRFDTLEVARELTAGGGSR